MSAGSSHGNALTRWGIRACLRYLVLDPDTGWVQGRSAQGKVLTSQKASLGTRQGLGAAPAGKAPAAGEGRAFAGLEPAERSPSASSGRARKGRLLSGSRVQQSESGAPVRMPRGCSFGAVWGVPRPPTGTAGGHRAGQVTNQHGLWRGPCPDPDQCKDVREMPWAPGCRTMLGASFPLPPGSPQRAAATPALTPQARGPCPHPTEPKRAWKSQFVNFTELGGLTRAGSALSSPRRCRCWWLRAGPAAAGRPARSPPLSPGPAGLKGRERRSEAPPSTPNPSTVG